MLKTIKAINICNKSSIAAIEGEEYLIQKKYSAEPIHKNKADKNVGIRISLF